MGIKPEQLDPKERDRVQEFLRSHPVGVLATVDAHGDPHASAVYFSVDNDMNVAFTTKHDTLKYANMMRHSVVMLTVFDAGSQTAVQIKGKATEVKDAAKQRDIYQGTLRAASLTGKDIVPPVAKIPAGRYVSFMVSPADVQLSEYGWGDSFARAIRHAHDPELTDDPL